MPRDRFADLQAQIKANETDANGSATDPDAVGITIDGDAAVYVRPNANQQNGVSNGAFRNRGFQNDNNNTNAAGQSDDYLEDFFATVEEMRENLQVMKTKSTTMRKLTADLLLQTDNAKLEQEKELDALVADVKKMGRKVKNDLGLIETMVDKRLPQAGVAYVSAEQRIKKMHYTMITKEFCDTMNEVNAIQSNYQEKLKEKMVRQLAVMNPDGTDYTNEQINEMIESGKTSIWTQNLLRETEDARQKLNAVQARHEEIVKLERSIMEVHEMFLDLAVLVESQGAMINNIEDNVLKTTDYVRTANVDLTAAAEHNRSFNKKRWCLIGIVVVIILIIVIILAIEFAPSSSSSSSNPTPAPSSSKTE